MQYKTWAANAKSTIVSIIRQPFPHNKSGRVKFGFVCIGVPLLFRFVQFDFFLFLFLRHLFALYENLICKSQSKPGIEPPVTEWRFHLVMKYTYLFDQVRYTTTIETTYIANLDFKRKLGMTTFILSLQCTSPGRLAVSNVYCFWDLLHNNVYRPCVKLRVYGKTLEIH